MPYRAIGLINTPGQGWSQPAAQGRQAAEQMPPSTTTPHTWDRQSNSTFLNPVPSSWHDFLSGLATRARAGTDQPATGSVSSNLGPGQAGDQASEKVKHDARQQRARDRNRKNMAQYRKKQRVSEFPQSVLLLADCDCVVNRLQAGWCTAQEIVQTAADSL